MTVALYSGCVEEPSVSSITSNVTVWAVVRGTPPDAHRPSQSTLHMLVTIVACSMRRRTVKKSCCNDLDVDDDMFIVIPALSAFTPYMDEGWCTRSRTSNRAAFISSLLCPNCPTNFFIRFSCYSRSCKIDLSCGQAFPP